MRAKYICQYCGCRTSNSCKICTACNSRLELVRKIHDIGQEIKKRAVLERYGGDKKC